jgi:hypothetical protein
MEGKKGARENIRRKRRRRMEQNELSLTRFVCAL